MLCPWWCISALPSLPAQHTSCCVLRPHLELERSRVLSILSLLKMLEWHQGRPLVMGSVYTYIYIYRDLCILYAYVFVYVYIYMYSWVNYGCLLCFFMGQMMLYRHDASIYGGFLKQGIPKTILLLRLKWSNAGWIGVPIFLGNPHIYMI